MKIKLLYFFCLLIFKVNYSQKNDFEAFAYNVSFGAITSTIGAIINKQPSEPLDQVIRKSLLQGALGGGVDFGSKIILREAQRQDKWEYLWMAKLVNSAGTSIKENASLNKDFWEKWYLNIGFNRIEFNTKDKFSVNYKIMPIAFIYTTDAFFRYNFDLNYSLKSGEFIFATAFENQLPNNVRASSTAGYIVYSKTDFNSGLFTYHRKLQIISHEIVHQYQSNDYSIFNTYLNKPFSKWGEKNKTINWLNQHLYIEWFYIILRPLYNLESNKANSYYDNFFEHEAGYYSETLD